MKQISIEDVIAAHDVYRNALKKIKNPQKDLARYLEVFIPKDMSFEWEQFDNEVLSPVIFPTKVKIDPRDPRTKWIDGERWDGYVLAHDSGNYRNTIPGLSKKELADLTAAWYAIPKSMLLDVFGTCSVCIVNGKITCKA